MELLFPCLFLKRLSLLSWQGVNGVVQYPRSFLKEAYQLVRERGGVCVSDEVSSFDIRLLDFEVPLKVILKESK